MKFFLAVLALAAVAHADVSHLVGQHPDAHAEIVNQQADVFPDQYQYQYQTSNGISAQESGQLRNAGTDNEAIAVQGSNQYTAPDGTPIQVTYVADENGYQPQGAHLPTPPPPQPIPDYIQRSLDYNRAHPQREERPQRF